MPEPPASITVQKLKSIRNTKAAMTLTQYESLHDVRVSACHNQTRALMFKLKASIEMAK